MDFKNYRLICPLQISTPVRSYKDKKRILLITQFDCKPIYLIIYSRDSFFNLYGYFFREDIFL